MLLGYLWANPVVSLNLDLFTCRMVLMMVLRVIVRTKRDDTPALLYRTWHVVKTQKMAASGEADLFNTDSPKWTLRTLARKCFLFK